jgi:hypothetical protein
VDWRKIPGNEHAISCLSGVLKRREGIALVGAGASAGLYPLRGSLLHRLATEAVNRGRAGESDRAYWSRNVSAYPDQVVRGIKRKLGDAIYAEVLRDIFRPKTGPDANRFTPLQGLLLSLPFKGYITTNFDPGLLEARLKLRSDSLATGFGTWRDGDLVDRWHSGAIFEEQPCPVLFAHGIYERSDTVVLGAAEYRDAYKPGPYRRCFEGMWGKNQLIFVGHGFSDPWMRFIANDVLMANTGASPKAPRHIALIGLEKGENYSHEIRDLFSDQYGAEVILYNVKSQPGGAEDHSELHKILNFLAKANNVEFLPTVVTSTSASSAAKAPVAQCWTHETTADEYFTGRKETIGKLNRWAADAEVRVIAVTGLGGLGKTSLVSHWLQQNGGCLGRSYQGLFFWSFYADRDVTSLAKGLMNFVITIWRFRMTLIRHQEKYCSKY